jgi:cysteine desulfurase/selenocysteine lyase
MNIDLIRQDTPGCTDKLFLNSAGSSLMPKIVTEKMTKYLHQEEKLGGYEVARLRENDINEFYNEIARLINCSTDNIAFAYNATDAYAKALSSIPFKSGDFLLTTNDDYISNQIAFLSLKKRFNINIVRAANLANGDIDLEDFERLLKEHRPILAAITHIPTNSGLVQQAEEIGKICTKYDTWYLLDACQSVGQLVTDVKKLGCDFLSATGRKFLRGPRGTGFLYVSDKVTAKGLEPLFIDMRGADYINSNEYKIQKSAKRFELWEVSYASLLGLTEAVRYANNIGIENIFTYNQKLVNRLRQNLSNIAGLSLLDKGSQLSNILTFKIDGHELNEIESTLKKADIFYSVSNKYTSLTDFSGNNVEQVIRLSPHYFNTFDEMDIVAEVIASV